MAMSLVQLAARLNPEFGERFFSDKNADVALKEYVLERGGYVFYVCKIQPQGRLDFGYAVYVYDPTTRELDYHRTVHDPVSVRKACEGFAARCPVS